MKIKFYKIIVILMLRLHNFSYKCSGFFSSKIESGVHPKHRLIDYHKFFVENMEPQDVVLDIGCGNGALTFDIAKKAAEVVGIDLNEKNIRIAREKFSAPNIEYIIGDVVKNFPASKFDVIILSNVLEHIEYRTELLNKIKNQGSKILIRVPMVNRDWITLYKRELGIEYRLDKSHFTEYTLESFQDELKRADLRLIKYSIQFGEIWAIIK